jgi:hypothetical protein
MPVLDTCDEMPACVAHAGPLCPGIRPCTPPPQQLEVTVLCPCVPISIWRTCLCVPPVADIMIIWDFQNVRTPTELEPVEIIR